jgi:hypothetical protein
MSFVSVFFIYKVYKMRAFYTTPTHSRLNLKTQHALFAHTH